MGRLSLSGYQKLKNSFDLPLAKFIAEAAMQPRRITYGDVASRFGGIAQGWGNKLSGVAIRCYEAGYPLLAVIVVNAQTGRPSVDATLYDDLGLQNEEAITAEMERVYAFDWRTTSLGSGSPGQAR